MKITFKNINPINDFKTFQSGKDVFQIQAYEVNRVYFSVLKKVAEPEEFEAGFNETISRVEKLAKGGLGSLIENAYVTLEKLKTEVSEEELRPWQYATSYIDFLLKFDEFIGKYFEIEKKLKTLSNKVDVTEVKELYSESINIIFSGLEMFAKLCVEMNLEHGITSEQQRAQQKRSEIASKAARAKDAENLQARKLVYEEWLKAKDEVNRGKVKKLNKIDLARILCDRINRTISEKSDGYVESTVLSWINKFEKGHVP